ncbi:MAG: ABC transporter permease [Deltaproteobacteria bacterium]|nr:ABC transporter permease [Deltaproteobacteria bacterium]MBW2237893.1 ABC transporter permease [Deltaproteobacteria bacterium]MBW2670155.1 ABC transporter permease [Deltaproteobacteria bacterium]
MPTRYLLQKIIRALLTICIIVTFVFIALRMSGDAALQIYGPDADVDAIEALREAWGLNKPIWKQYLIYIGNIFHGDLGQSYLDGRDAVEVVMERVPKTLSLMWITAIVTFLIGIPAGIYSALHHNTVKDRSTMTLAVMGLSIPNFFLGVLLILLFSVTWRLLPSAGSESWRHYIMPVITMATAEASVFARFMRSSMLEVLSQPYIRTAIAKGVPWRKVVRGHALPNAAIPTVTVAGFFVGSLIVGGVITENVFAWPGVGRLLVDSVANRDLAVVQVAILLIAVSMVSANLIVDLSYGWLDPRVSDLQTKE